MSQPVAFPPPTPGLPFAAVVAIACLWYMHTWWCSLGLYIRSGWTHIQWLGHIHQSVYCAVLSLCTPLHSFSCASTWQWFSDDHTLLWQSDCHCNYAYCLCAAPESKHKVPQFQSRWPESLSLSSCGFSQWIFNSFMEQCIQDSKECVCRPNYRAIGRLEERIFWKWERKTTLTQEKTILFFFFWENNSWLWKVISFCSEPCVQN